MSKLKLQSKPAELDPKVIAEWNALVVNILKEAKGKDASLPLEQRGTYLRYSHDAQGRLSLPRRKGRIKPHRSQRLIRISQLVPALFGAGLQEAFSLAAAKAKEEGKEDVTPITQETVTRVQKWALKKAAQIVDAPRKGAQARARQRQQASRRINVGLVPGNSLRIAHAG